MDAQFSPSAFLSYRPAQSRLPEPVREQPVTAGEILFYKSHRRHIVAVRGLCWLCFTTVALSCWQAGVAVHHRCNTGRKCTAAAAALRASILCARCHSYRKRLRGDALHLPCMTPHPPVQRLSIACDSLCICWWTGGQCAGGDGKQVGAWKWSLQISQEHSVKMEGSSPTRHSAPAELVTSSEWKIGWCVVMFRCLWGFYWKLKICWLHPHLSKWGSWCCMRKEEANSSYTNDNCFCFVLVFFKKREAFLWSCWHV